MTKIQALLVSENKRLSFLPKYFGKRMIAAEHSEADEIYVAID